MAKGISQRRRLKRAVEAARGNLHKIASGKASPSDLPEAPKLDAEKLPASLRKMLVLKEVVRQKNMKRGRENNSATSTNARARNLTESSKSSARGTEDGPSTSGRVQAQQGQAQQGQAQQGQAQQGQAQQGQAQKVHIIGGNAFTDPFVQRKLKDKKKQFLKRKVEKQKQKGTSGNIIVEKELQLKDSIKFGEVVHAPLKVHLKRRNWTGKEKTANDRCKEVFLKQMQQAQQGLVGGQDVVDEGIAVGQTARRGAKGAKAGGAVLSAKAGAAAQKNLKRKAPMDPEREELRQQVIQSYRASKSGGGFPYGAVGNATLDSLSQLVGKVADAGKTHTLA